MTRRSRKLWGLLGLLLSAGGASAALAAEPQLELFHLEPIRGHLFTEFRYRYDDRQRSSGQTTTDEYLLREGIELNLDGYVGHPNLLDWNGHIRVGGIHQWSSVNDEHRDTNGFLLGYSLFGHVLREKPASLQAYAHGSRDVINRSFAQSIEIDQHTHGLVATFRGEFPTSLQIERRQRLETSDLRIDEEEAYTGRLTITDERDPRFRTSLRYEHETVDRTNRFLVAENATQDLSEERDSLTLSNRWVFGDEALPQVLSGEVRVTDRRGFFRNELFSAHQRLDLNHTPSLMSYYHGSYSYDRTTEQTDEVATLEAGARQSIYESLDITGRIFGTDRRVTTGSEQSVGGELDLDYRKTSPFGMHRAGLSLGREYREEQSDGRLRRVRDEAVTLVGITRVRLRQPNVVPGSVFVTDANNLLNYVEGVDYLLFTFGTFVEVARIVDGGIADGETVLVDYNARAAGEAAYFTDQFLLRYRLELDPLPLAVYVEYRLREQKLQSGDDPGNLDRDQRWLAGMEFRPMPELMLQVEYEVRDLRLTPGWRAWRARASYIRSFHSAASLSLSADYEMLTYRDADRFGLDPGRDYLETLAAGAQLTSRLSDHMLLRLNASYQQVRGRTRSRLGQAGMSWVWQYGLLEAAIESRVGAWEQESDTGVNGYVGFSLKRHL